MVAAHQASPAWEAWTQVAAVTAQLVMEDLALAVPTPLPQSPGSPHRVLQGHRVASLQFSFLTIIPRWAIRIPRACHAPLSVAARDSQSQNPLAHHTVLVAVRMTKQRTHPRGTCSSKQDDRIHIHGSHLHPRALVDTPLAALLRLVSEQRVRVLPRRLCHSHPAI